MSNRILIRGGGDLASGVALRLHHAGFGIVITELPQPLAVRRKVAFAEAVYEDEITIEDVTGRKARSVAQAFSLLGEGLIAVLVDPNADILKEGGFAAMVDARLIKQAPERLIGSAPLTIGIGPGFTAGENVHAVIETQRGHTLGRVYWKGSASADSGQPEGDPRRVLRAPAEGVLQGYAEIGEHLEIGQMLAEVAGLKITAPFKGVLRGLIHPGIHVPKGMKLGDVDPRDNRDFCFLASDKALAIGGGVLEALLARQPPSSAAQATR